MARVAIHERDLIGPGLALVARVLAAGGIMAGVWLALRSTARVLLRVLRLRGTRTLVLGQRIELVVSCAGRRLLCALAAGMRLRGARTLVLGYLLEVIIERVIQRIALIMSCAGRRLLCALAVGIEPHGLFGGSAVELVIDRAEIILGICRVARARSDFVLHATIATGERIVSIPVAIVPATRGERIVSIPVAIVPATRGERIVSIPVAVVPATRGERIVSIPVAVVPATRGERIVSIPIAHCVVESFCLLKLGRHLLGVPDV
jgi:hypothetical protein